MNHDVGRSQQFMSSQESSTWQKTDGCLTSLTSLLPVSPSSGACRAAELCESSAGGVALQRGLAARTDRAAGTTQDWDSAAAAAPATLGTCLHTAHVLVSCTGFMYWWLNMSWLCVCVFQLRGQFDVIVHQMQNSNNSNDLSNQLTSCMEK